MHRNRNPTARLFVAVDPPGEVREALAGWARTALRGAGNGRGGPTASAGTSLRVLDPELLHLTVCFLGARPTGEIETIATRLAACDGPVGELSLGAPLWLPTRRPRALAVEVHDDDHGLNALRASVLAALREVCGPDADGGPRTDGRTPASPATRSRHDRRFHPHITLARMRGGAAPRERALPATPSLSFLPRELVLYRSWLSPEGATYEPLASFAIG